MTRLLRISVASAALCAAGSSSWALTAEEAWQSWVSIAADYGETVSAASTSQSGATFTASGVNVAMSMEDMSISGTIGDVALTENSDGTVAITIPDRFSMDLEIAPQYGEKVEAMIDFALSGMSLTAADGDAGGVTFAFGAPQMDVSLGELKVDGVVVPVNFSAVISGSAGTYGKSGGDAAQMTSNFTADSLAMSFDGRDPEGKGSGKGSLTVANIVSSSVGQGQMMFMSPERLPALLKAGAAVKGTTTIGATSFAMDGDSGTETFSVSGALDGGSTTLSLDADQATYAVDYKGFDATLSGSEIPLPEVTFGLAETRMDLVFPIAQSDQPRPYMLAVALKDLSVADGIWNLLDPGMILPRDPATVAFNVAGTGNWLIDILDPQALATPESMPGEVHSLTLSDVQIKAAGAEFTAEGAFTFDNSDMVTFGGMPAPDGKLNATLTGGNALLDNLVKMRILPADQANGIKLGAGMFARPGDGPDTLTTEIGVSPDGTVSANGIPIPIR